MKKLEFKLDDDIRNKDLASTLGFIKSGRLDVNAPNREGYTPLHEATMIRDIKALKWLLIQKKIDVNAKDKQGYTSLHQAIEFYNFDAFKLLLTQEKINVSAKNKQGYTPLQLAIKENNFDMALELLKRTDIDINNQGWLSLFGMALDMGDLNIAKILIKSKAFNMQTQSDQQFFRQLINNMRFDIIDELPENANANSDVKTIAHMLKISETIVHGKMLVQDAIYAALEKAEAFNIKTENDKRLFEELFIALTKNNRLETIDNLLKKVEVDLDDKAKKHIQEIKESVRILIESEMTDFIDLFVDAVNNIVDLNLALIRDLLMQTNKYILQEGIRIRQEQEQTKMDNISDDSDEEVSSITEEATLYQADNIGEVT